MSEELARIRDMKLLVTGGAGMLGSAIVECARDAGFDVVAPSRRLMDCEDESSVRDFFKKERPEAVIHCAAKVGGISANMAAPEQFLDKNIRIDSSVISICAENGINNLIYIGSSCIFPNNRLVAMPESEILQGPLEPTNEGYALAKLVGLKRVQFGAREKNWRSFILSNLYGPRDHFELDRSHMLAAIINKVHIAKSLQAEEIEMWGDGTARREFLYVKDAATFIVNSILDLRQYPDVLNVGAGIDYSVREYYEFVLEAFDFKCNITPNLSRPTGMKRKLLDVNKAMDFGWNPVTDIRTGIKKTIDWYEESIGKVKS